MASNVRKITKVERTINIKQRFTYDRIERGFSNHAGCETSPTRTCPHDLRDRDSMLGWILQTFFACVPLVHTGREHRLLANRYIAVDVSLVVEEIKRVDIPTLVIPEFCCTMVCSSDGIRLINPTCIKHRLIAFGY